MNPLTIAVLYLAKITRRAVSLRGHGGSTLPGYLVEKLAPGSIESILKLLPATTIVVTGTNGKTTTTKMIADMLRSEGKRVFTNDSGSNFVRGIVSQVVKETGWTLQPLKHDVAVLELDEAHGAQFVKYLKPGYVVALNVLRDQLDRFGEIDRTAELIGTMLKAAKTGCVVNGNEPSLVRIGEKLTVPVEYYAVANELRRLFPTDAEFITIDRDVAAAEELAREVKLVAINGQRGTYLIEGKKYEVELAIRGIYNLQNAAAVLALLRRLLPDVTIKRWFEHLATIPPAFGRGEAIQVDGQTVELVLVKNPAGFQQGLLSYRDDAAVMIAINDNYADGRDISWLWDVDFGLLGKNEVAVVSGQRAYDMALRLQYDEIKTDEVQEDLADGLNRFLDHAGSHKRIFCNYTAMLGLRAEISKKVPLERLL